MQYAYIHILSHFVHTWCVVYKFYILKYKIMIYNQNIYFILNYLKHLLEFEVSEILKFEIKSHHYDYLYIYIYIYTHT